MQFRAEISPNPEKVLRQEEVRAYDVIQVGPNQLRIIWTRAYPLLVKSLTANSEMDMDDIIIGLADQSIQFWVVVRTEAQEIEAVFLTSIERDKGEWVLSLYNLGGQNPRAWVHDVHERMHQFARAEDCRRVRLCGRAAWQRILPGYAVVGQRGGHLVYERPVE